jgi:hypothetical protein
LRPRRSLFVSVLGHGLQEAVGQVQHWAGVGKMLGDKTFKPFDSR